MNCSINISLNNAGKRFNRDWVFKNFSYQFISGKHYAITGPNGSGKSTLLQIIAGSTQTSEGTIQYKIQDANTTIASENIFQSIALVAPYIELIEEMTITEFLKFHEVFKKFVLPVHDIITAIGLENAATKQIRYYSSGMKQRVKLAQAIFSNTPIVLLDEPCTNLDSVGYQLYHQLLQQYGHNKTIIISSNDENEISFCSERINMSALK